MVQLVKKLPVGLPWIEETSWGLLFLKYNIRKSWNLFHLRKKKVQVDYWRSSPADEELKMGFLSNQPYLIKLQLK